jgi:hypothetical protein
MTFIIQLMYYVDKSSQPPHQTRPSMLYIMILAHLGLHITYHALVKMNAWSTLPVCVQPEKAEQTAIANIILVAYFSLQIPVRIQLLPAGYMVVRSGAS